MTACEVNWEDFLFRCHFWPLIQTHGAWEQVEYFHQAHIILSMGLSPTAD